MGKSHPAVEGSTDTQRCRTQTPLQVKNQCRNRTSTSDTMCDDLQKIGISRGVQTNHEGDW